MNPMLSKLSYRLRTSPAFRAGVILLVLLALTGGFLLIRYLVDPYNCRIVAGVSIDGVDLSGMTKGEARDALKSAAEETILSQSLTVELPEETLILSPKEMGLKLDIHQAVKDAYALGRSTDSSAALNSGLAVYLTFDEEALFERLLAYTTQYDTELTQFRYQLEGAMPDLTEAGFQESTPCPSLVLTLGTPKNHLDIGKATLAIRELYSRGISASKAGAYTLRIPSDPQELPDAPDLDALYSQFCKEAADAYADLDHYEILPASYGLVFDTDAAQRQLDSAAWGETVTIPMTYQIPEIMSDAVPFQNVLGACETRHTDDENRNTNLRLVCEILDGFILEPGEEFSYNGVIGERTKERGFKPATAYSGTRVIQDFGGGVCQGSSTLYNCVLLADLEVTERVCHGFTVGYLPIGLDAAVNWATKTDFKFRNNFHFPIQIRAKMEDGYMKMQILGVDEKDYYVEMRSGRSDEEHRIYSNSYKYKYDKETGELISKDLEARSSYMYHS